MCVKAATGTVVADTHTALRLLQLRDKVAPCRAPGDFLTRGERFLRVGCAGAAADVPTVLSGILPVCERQRTVRERAR